MRNGCDLAAYTQVDVLFQAYFTAFMIMAGIGVAPNPGMPYVGSQTQKAFGTLGGPDAAGTLCEMATRALKASWYHKWVKDLRMRPEAYGALVHARKTGANPMPQAAADLHPDVLGSAALPIVHAAYGTYLLPQAFPEGSPTHPCYPTGHGTVGGACITALKFFFNGSQKIKPLLTAAGRDLYEPTSDGLALKTYGGADAASIDINGELNKLAWNVTSVTEFTRVSTSEAHPIGPFARRTGRGSGYCVIERSRITSRSPSTHEVRRNTATITNQ